MQKRSADFNLDKFDEFHELPLGNDAILRQAKSIMIRYLRECDHVYRNRPALKAACVLIASRLSDCSYLTTKDVCSCVNTSTPQLSRAFLQICQVLELNVPSVNTNHLVDRLLGLFSDLSFVERKWCSHLCIYLDSILWDNIDYDVSHSSTSMILHRPSVRAVILASLALESLFYHSPSFSDRKYIEYGRHIETREKVQLVISCTSHELGGGQVLSPALLGYMCRDIGVSSKNVKPYIKRAKKAICKFASKNFEWGKLVKINNVCSYLKDLVA